MEKIEDLKVQLKSILEINTENIRDNSLLVDDLGMTSFDMMMLIFDVEENYNCHLNFEGLSAVATVKDLFEWIRGNIK